MNKKYPALSFVCGFFQFVAGLILIFAILTAVSVVYFFTQIQSPLSSIPYSFPISIVLAVFIVLIGVAIFVSILARIDFYRCIMEIEKNTRSMGHDSSHWSVKVNS